MPSRLSLGDEAAAAGRQQRQIAAPIRARARGVVTFQHRQVGRGQRAHARRRRDWRLQPLGEQVGRHVDDGVAEPCVEPERVGVEAVLEQTNAGRPAGDGVELAHQRARDAGGRARPRRQRADAGHRAARVREADADHLRRRPRQRAAVGIQIQVGAAKPRGALARRERGGVAAAAIRRAEGIEQDAGCGADILLAQSGDVDHTGGKVRLLFRACTSRNSSLHAHAAIDLEAKPSPKAEGLTELHVDPEIAHDART